MLALSPRNLTASFAALALCGSLALAQAPPTQPASPGTPAPAAAPQPPRPPMRPHMSERGEMRGPRPERGDFRGGSAGRFNGDGGPMAMGGGFHMGPAGMWWKNSRIVERLNLSADQTKKMDDIVEQSRLQLIDLRATLEKQQVLLGPILDANPVDMAKASAQIDKVANARADLEKANAKMLLSIRSVLTPDQWTKLHQRHMGAPDSQAAPPPAGGSGAAADGPGGGRWHGRTGGPHGDGMDTAAPPIDPQ
ncbi:MAG TPA: Spy/CpxP family protein refolding chaperone [Acidobacteriaceae bacterium]|nr:Spy/CpxP family protein refolding chaperone [Acidobacteriaceae bacterium]